jgi:hypothetical protein
MPMLDFTTRSLSQEGIRRMALAKQVKDTTYPVLVVEDESKNDIRFSLVTDPDLINRLESEPTIKVYRAMQMVDGKLYPPMAGKVDG